MRLYLVKQDENEDYDTYDSMIVCAKNEEEARLIHPSGEDWDGKSEGSFDSWCPSKLVTVTSLGQSDPEVKRGVVLASFNAG